MKNELKIIKKRCPHNHQCRVVKSCPANALSQKENEVPEIDYSKCIKCGKCISLCPKKVFILENITLKKISI